MIRKLKRLARRLVPKSLWVPLIIFREKMALAQLATTACDPRPLRASESLLLEKILSNEEVDARWKVTEKALDALGLPEAAGGVNQGDRRAIYYLLHALKPRNILEIGTHIGSSTMVIARALGEIFSANDTPTFTTVDITDVNHPAGPWIAAGSPASPSVLARRLAVADQIKFVTAPSLVFLKDTDEQFDLIFLDGDHGAQAVYCEIPAALSKLNKNGVILLHDFFPNLKPLWTNGVVVPGPALAIDRLQREGAGLAVIPMGALPWPTKHGSKVSSLALVVKH